MNDPWRNRPHSPASFSSGEEGFDFVQVKAAKDDENEVFSDAELNRPGGETGPEPELCGVDGNSVRHVRPDGEVGVRHVQHRSDRPAASDSRADGAAMQSAELYGGVVCIPLPRGCGRTCRSDAGGAAHVGGPHRGPKLHILGRQRPQQRPRGDYAHRTLTLQRHRPDIVMMSGR